MPKGESTTIISLLGHKPNGMSEYSFYSFDQDTFEGWLKSNSTDSINVIRHPTEDFAKIPDETLKSIKSDVLECLKRGHTVVLVDSGDTPKAD